MSNYKVLGTGSYGCVISPGYKCKNKTFDTSKLVETSLDREEIVKKEILISKKIMKLKTETFNPEDYFCLIKDNCKVNIEKFLNDNPNIHHGCKISPISTYVALQGDNCGVDMFFNKKKKNLFKKLNNDEVMHRNVKNLLIGLKHLQKINLTICDIKPENLMLKDNTIKFLDFGGSHIHKKTDTEFFKRVSFTPGFVPIEVAYIFASRNYIYFEDIKRSVLDFTELQRHSQNPHLNQLIESFVRDKEFKQNYRKHGLGKYDIFSLGVSLKEIINSIGYKNNKLDDLIKKMTDIVYKERFDVEQCLSHPFITDTKTSQKKIKSIKQIVAKKPVVKKKSPAKKLLAKKPLAKKKSPAKNTPAKKPVAKKKSPAKKPTQKKRLVAKKPVAKKKSPAKKPTQKKKPVSKKTTQTKKRKTRSNKGKQRGPYKKKYVIKT